MLIWMHLALMARPCWCLQQSRPRCTQDVMLTPMYQYVMSLVGGPRQSNLKSWSPNCSWNIILVNSCEMPGWGQQVRRCQSNGWAKSWAQPQGLPHLSLRDSGLVSRSTQVLAVQRFPIYFALYWLGICLWFHCHRAMFRVLTTIAIIYKFLDVD